MAISVTLTSQKMKDGSTKLQLTSPYSPALPTRCRALGGKWNAETKKWYFDTRDADRVRAMVLETFGIDPLAAPDEAPELVTVRLSLDAFNTSARELWMFGREIAHQPDRDGRPSLGRDVIVVNGGFLGGGSRANPAMNAKPGTILEVRDVPRPLADEQIAKWAARAEQLAATAAEKATRRGEPGCDEGIINSYLRDAEASKTAVRIVESAPAPDAVPIAIQQAVALFRAMVPGDRRAAILAALGTLSADERRGLVEEIGKFVEQGAL